MPGKSISAYVDDETAAAVDQITTMTGVKKANFGGRALKFYAGLSEDARRALTGIESAGTPQDRQFVMREVTRVLAIAHLKIIQRKVVAEMRADIGGDGSDKAIEEATNTALRI
jgi:hypothetical protein